MELKEKLLKIQQTVKATKDQYNDFGKYPYRSAESIIENIKPILEETKTFIILSDGITDCGGRVYVMASATLYDVESSDTMTTTAYAREAEQKKGMDEAQITGSASSYARKYALSGLLLLDDNKDADTNEYQQRVKKAEEEESKQKKTAPKSKEEKPILCADCKKPISEHEGVSPEKLAEATAKKYGVPLCYDCTVKRRTELPFDL